MQRFNTHKTRIYIVIAVVVVAFLLAALTIHAGHNLGDDFALYINQAKSLATGSIDKLIDKNYFTTYFSSFKPGSTLYPWGYPLALTIVYWLFGMSLTAFKMLNVIVFSVSLIPLYFLFKNKFARKSTVLFLLALIGFNFAFLIYADSVVSDLMFLFVSNFCLWLTFRFIVEGKFWINRYVSMTLLAAVTFYADLVRSNGIIIVPFIALVCLDKVIRERKQIRANFKKYVIDNLYLLIPFIGFAVMYVVFFKIFPDESGSHLEILADITDNSIKTNLKYYLELPLEYFQYTWVYIVALIFAIIGGLRYLHKHYLILSYAILTMVVYILWPTRQGIRFVFPIVPIFVFFMLLGTEYILGRIRYKWLNLHMLVSGLLVLFFLVTSVQKVVLIQQNQAPQEGAYTANASEMFDYIGKNLPTDAIYTFHKARTFTLITDRKALILNNEDDILLRKPDYVIINKYGAFGEQVDLTKSVFLKTMPIVFENKQYAIYKLSY